MQEIVGFFASGADLPAYGWKFEFLCKLSGKMKKGILLKTFLLKVRCVCLALKTGKLKLKQLEMDICISGEILVVGRYAEFSSKSERFHKYVNRREILRENGSKTLVRLQAHTQQANRARFSALDLLNINPICTKTGNFACLMQGLIPILQNFK